MPRHLLAPSILASDFARLGEEVTAVTEAGADWIHVDVMDGHFVPVITLGPAIVKACKAHTDLPLDVHLMIEQPERHVEAFAEAGASFITVHQEACPHLHRVIQLIKEAGCKAGVAINPGTPASALASVLGDVDLVLAMTVNPGWGGQKAIRSAVAKASELKTLRRERELDFLIEVDGGVKVDNIGDFAAADVLVSGSGIFKAEDYAARMAAMRVALRSS